MIHRWSGRPLGWQWRPQVLRDWRCNVHSIYLSASAQEKNIGADGVSEETRMQELARDIAEILSARGLVVYLNRPEWSLNEIIEDSNNKIPNLHLALHSNAGGGTGVETWCYRISGTKSAEFGAKLQAAVVKAIGLSDRGIKDATVPGHRLAEVANTKATACLIELFFHDRLFDVAAFTRNRKSVIDAITGVILEWFGIASKDFPTQMMDFAMDNGWLNERRNPYTLPTWWELIAFMRNVKGR